MKKRILALLLAFVTALCAANAAAEVYETDGDGKTTVCFYVESYGSATVSFVQSEGKCQELSYTHLIDGILGEEEEWGKYHFYVTSPSGSVTRVDWDKTFNGGDFSLSLSLSGVYTVRVVPFTAQEMTDSWTLDRFVDWTKQPRWWVNSCKNCAVMTSDPTRRTGTVHIYCYDENGNLIKSESHTVSGSGTVYPPSVSGYKAESSGEYVALDAGGCTPSAVWFYYRKDSPAQPDGAIPFPAASRSVKLRNPNAERIRPQCGPGYEYRVFASMNGSTKLYDPRKITYMNAHFTVGDWAYVEFGYTDGVLRYGFFEKSLFSVSDWSAVPAYTLTSGRAGTVNADTTPYNGPGTNCGSYASCKLYRGDEVHAWMEYGGWYLCRFYNGHGNEYGWIYLWVPGYNISWR